MTVNRPDQSHAGESSFITASMRALIGRVVDRRVSHPVSASDIRRWVIATWYPAPPPLGLLSGDSAAPDEFNPFAWSVAETMEPVVPHGRRDPDHFEKNAGALGPGLAHQVAGGLDAEYGVAMRRDDVVEAVTTLERYAEKPGRLGLMLFTTVRHDWTNQRGETVKVSRETSIRYGR